MSVNQSEPMPLVGDYVPAMPEAGKTLPLPETAPTARRSPNGVLRIVAVGALIIVLALGGTALFVRTQFSDRIYPNVTIQGVTVGNLSAPEAKSALDRAFAAFVQKPVLLHHGDRTWQPTLQDLGAKLEIDQAVAKAQGLSQNPDLIDSFRSIQAAWNGNTHFDLALSIDQAKLRAYVEARAAEFNKPAVDASLARKGLKTDVRPASSGEQVMVEETLASLTAALQSLRPETSVSLQSQILEPKVSTAAAEQARAQIDTMVSGPVILKSDTHAWTWTPEELAPLVLVAHQPAADGKGEMLAVSLDTAAISERLKPIVEKTTTHSVNPRVAWNGGNLSITRDGKPGFQLDEAAALPLITAAITSTDHREVALPFQTIDPPVTAQNLSSLGIREQISVGQSDFSGSAAYRITNIEAGMRLLNGLLIAPGAEFSFNNTVGEIDKANGFVEGYAIISNRTQLEWGGGICQDSTTVFRAAFWGGFPITERWGHSFYINWYDKYAFASYGNGPGMDATIFTGGPDLKFVNDTGHWLLIQTGVSEADTLAEVRIYGTKPARTVKLEGPTISNRRPAPSQPVYVANNKRAPGHPYQSDHARGGMDIRFARVIVGTDGTELKRDNFLTSFKPWPNIFEYNPGDLGPDGQPRPATPAEPTPQPTAAVPADGTAPTASPAGSSEQPAPQPTTAAPEQPAPQPTPVPPVADGGSLQPPTMPTAEGGN